MKNLVTLFICSAILFGSACAQSVHDDACNVIQKQVSSCFDRSTLGFCAKVADEWRAIEIATCDPRLCCNAKLMACTMDGDCQTESTTASTIATSTSTEQSAVTCVTGKLKKHETDCKRFYYCSNNNWKEGACSAGGFDESRMSCAFGGCNST